MPINYTDFEQIPIAISVTQLAHILGIGKNTAYDLVRSGRIKSTRIGHQIRISKAALLEFLDCS